MKDLTIEKLEERNTGTYHLKRKLNEVIDTVNEMVKLLQNLEKSGIELEDHSNDSSA